jgi:hypothetical protein
MRPTLHKCFSKRWLMSLSLLIALAGSAIACQVPVFRYALERWAADDYKLLVVTDGGLSTAEQDWLAEFNNMSSGGKPFQWQELEVSGTSSPRIEQLWREHSSNAGAIVLALYPESSTNLANQLAFVGPLTESAPQKLLDSPVRKQLADSLLSGKSAVWLFIESGDQEQDEAAISLLQRQLRNAEQQLEVPSADELEIAPEVLEKVQVPLKVEFSVLRVPRNDPREQVLVDCLLNSEPDLRSFEEPIAFPVFGRGRVLYGLVGKGINADTIREASAFIVGPCSCQVKNQNPGFDLLLGRDWERDVGGVLISDPLPEAGSEPRLLTIPPGRSRTNEN